MSTHPGPNIAWGALQRICMWRYKFLSIPHIAILRPIRFPSFFRGRSWHSRRLEGVWEHDIDSDMDLILPMPSFKSGEAPGESGERVADNRASKVRHETAITLIGSSAWAWKTRYGWRSDAQGTESKRVNWGAEIHSWMPEVRHGEPRRIIKLVLFGPLMVWHLSCVLKRILWHGKKKIHHLIFKEGLFFWLSDGRNLLVGPSLGAELSRPWNMVTGFEASESSNPGQS